MPVGAQRRCAPTNFLASFAWFASLVKKARKVPLQRMSAIVTGVASIGDANPGSLITASSLIFTER
jgi:hypothetical protein